MKNKEPWLLNWKIEREIGKGGQGATALVINKVENSRGVLKILKNQKSAEARRRMYREVSNLRVLHNAGCRVPEVFDGNTLDFEDKSQRLYFVMEFIDGKPLSTLIEDEGKLSISNALKLVIELCFTVNKALTETVVHRDLKPENIIVKSIKPMNVYIVDYGLSFNSQMDDNQTRISETLDNKFLSLPERRVPGGNKRDPRSDLTGICGILYYCITGHRPIDLVGSDGKPPHRQIGRSIREYLNDDPLLSQFESFFDQGFSTNIDNRFQSIDELNDRLELLLNPTINVSNTTPMDYAKKVAERFLREDRKTQIEAYTKNSEIIIAQLDHCINKYRRINPYSIRKVGKIFPLNAPKEEEPLHLRASYVVGIANREYRYAICYEIFVKGSQCVVYKCLLENKKKKQNDWLVTSELVPVIWYDGMKKPDIKILLQDFDSTIVSIMEKLELKYFN